MTSHQTDCVIRSTMVPPTLPGVAIAAMLLLQTGCVSDPNRVSATNPAHPGPAGGRAAGAAVGVAAGNAVGGVVGVGEGLAAGASVPFHKTTRIVRSWRSETTPDGRTVRVPVDTVVDEHGRPVNPPGVPGAR